MKIGEAVKTTIDELSKASWIKKWDWGTREIFCVQTVVHPHFTSAVRYLIAFGLDQMGNEFSHLSIRNDTRGAVILVSNLPTEKRAPLGPTFFEKLVQAIESFIKLFSKEWTLIDLSTAQTEGIELPEDCLKKCKEKDVVIYTRKRFKFKCKTMETAEEYLETDSLLRTIIEILDVDIFFSLLPQEKDYIVGNKTTILSFLTSLYTELSPIQMAKPSTVATVLSLETLCIQALWNYSLFKPTLAPSPLSLAPLPEVISDRIRNYFIYHMELIENPSLLKKYHGKIVVFTASTFKPFHPYYLDTRSVLEFDHGYSIYPDTPSYKVGIILETQDPEIKLRVRQGYYENDDIYNLYLLIPKRKKALDKPLHLALHKIKFSVLKMRLPTLNEFNKIMESLEKQHACFSSLPPNTTLDFNIPTGNATTAMQDEKQKEESTVEIYHC